MRAEGNITTVIPHAGQNIDNPGSDILFGKILEYDNVMGVFNLLRKPKMRISRTLSHPHRYYDRVGNLQDSRFGIISCTMEEDIEYLQNPAAGLKYPADIQACLVFEVNNTQDLFLDNINLIREKRFFVRTAYYPIACLKDKTFFLVGKNGKAITLNNVYVKIMANFEVDTDLDPSAKPLNSIFVGQYAVESKLQQYASDFERLPFNPNSSQVSNLLNPTFQTRYLSGSITSNVSNAEHIVIRSGTTFGSNPITIRALYSIEVEANVEIPANVSLEVVNISDYLSTPTPDCSRFVPSVSARELEFNFCNQNEYIAQRLKQVALAEENQAGLPEEEAKNALIKAYPNPADNTATIVYVLGQKDKVSLSISNLLGKKVASISENASQDEGEHQVLVDLSYLEPGIYIYTLQTSEGSESKRLLIER